MARTVQPKGRKKTVHVRFANAEHDRLVALLARVPMLSMSDLVRLTTLRSLPALEEDPRAIVEPAPE